MLAALAVVGALVSCSQELDRPPEPAEPIASTVATEYRVVYLRAAESADGVVRSDARTAHLVAEAAVDPIEIPARAYQRKLGEAVAVTGAVEELSTEDWGRRDEVVTLEAFPLEPRERVRAAEVTRPAASPEQGRAALEAALAERGEHPRARLAFHPEVPFDVVDRVDWFGAETASDRRSALMTAELEERRPEIQALTSASRAWLEHDYASCEWLYASRIDHAAVVACSPADLVALRDDPRVRGVSIPGYDSPDSLSGEEAREIGGLQMDIILTDDPDSDGMELDGQESGQIRVAVADREGFYRADEHPGFDDWYCPTSNCSRISAQTVCDDEGSCSSGNTDGDAAFNHGIRILGWYMDLQQNQDSYDISCTLNSQCDDDYECEAKSGRCQLEDEFIDAYSYFAKEADLYLYRLEGGEGTFPVSYEASVEHAADAGMDIYQISHGAERWRCENPRDGSEFAAAADYAVSHDMVLVASASNSIEACDDDCHVNRVGAARPEVIVVGAASDSTSQSDANWNLWPAMGEDMDLDDDPNCSIPTGATCQSSCDDNDDCEGARCADGVCLYTCWSSGLGGADIRTQYYGVQDNDRSIIDIVGPSEPTFRPHVDSTGTHSYNSAAGGGGTSQASPAIGAAVVSLLDWARYRGYSLIYSNPGVVNAALLTMGDGTDSGGTTAHAGDVPGVQESVTGLDPLWGAGRLNFRHFSEVGLDWPWGINYGTVAVSTTGTYYVRLNSGPLSSDYESLTAAIVWNETNLDVDDTSSYAADIVMSVIGTSGSGSCPTTPSGSQTNFGADSSFDVQKRVRFRESVGGPTLDNRCMYLKLGVYSLPASRTISLFSYREDLDRESSESLGTCAEGSGATDCVR